MIIGLHNRLRHIRKKHGLNQTDIGLACNPQVSASAVGHWENKDASKRNRPKSDQIEVYARLTNTPFEVIINDEIDIETGFKVEIENEKPDDRQILEALDLLRLLSSKGLTKVMTEAKKHRLREANQR